MAKRIVNCLIALHANPPIINIFYHFCRNNASRRGQWQNLHKFNGCNAAASKANHPCKKCLLMNHLFIRVHFPCNTLSIIMKHYLNTFCWWSIYFLEIYRKLLISAFSNSKMAKAKVEEKEKEKQGKERKGGEKEKVYDVAILGAGPA